LARKSVISVGKLFSPPDSFDLEYRSPSDYFSSTEYIHIHYALPIDFASFRSLFAFSTIHHRPWTEYTHLLAIMAEAVELKNKGNEAFKNRDWPTALEFYSKAIEKNDKEPAFYTNRAQVCASWS